MIAFLALLFVLLVIYALTKTKEGFNPMNTSPEHTINIPVNKIPPMLAPVGANATVGNTVSTPASNGSIFSDCSIRASPGMLPGSLPTAPYEQIAVGSPLPYQDTTLIKANRQQLINMLEMLKGFLAYEAQEIAERSDPTIQLPLQTARTDFHVLQAEVEVLNRNPGIQPTITLSHLNEIASNLAFLQREVRLIGSAGPIQGPIYEFTKPVEGFTATADSGVQTATSMSAAPITTYAPSPGTILSDIAAANSTAPNDIPGKTAQSGPAPFNKDTAEQGGPNASLKDIKDFIARIKVEVISLNSSGTYKEIVEARTTALREIQSSMQDLVDQVDKGIIQESEIPVKKWELENALPILDKPGQPIPELIKSAGLPPFLANLFPPNMQNDPLVTKQIGNMANKYLDTILNGISFSVKYTSEREAQAGGCTKKGMNVSASTIDKTGFPSPSDLDNASNEKFTPMDLGLLITDSLAPVPSDAGRGPSHFNWKERSKEIESQIKKRGLQSSDFGVMPSKTKVSDDFSWRGYARMMCTRLQATMDPHLPVLCGCPPMDWPGWRNAK